MWALGRFHVSLWALVVMSFCNYPFKYHFASLDSAVVLVDSFCLRLVFLYLLVFFIF